VVSVGDLLARSAQLGLSLRAGPGDGPATKAVTAVESLAGLATAQPGSVVIVLTRRGAASWGYELDVAIRSAAERELSALILPGLDEVSLSTQRLAARARLPILAAPSGADVAELVLRIARMLNTDAARVLDVTRQALARLPAWEATGSLDRALELASEFVGIEFRFEAGHPSSTDDGVAVSMRGAVTGWLGAVGNSPVVELVLPALAAVAARLLERELADRYASAQTRAELLAQILVADRSLLPALVTSGRRLGLALDHVHTVMCFRSPDDEDASDSAAQRRQMDVGELAVLQALPADADRWHVVRDGPRLMVVRSRSSAYPGLDQVRAQAETILASLIERLGVAVFAGVGTSQRGVEGLRQSAAEASGAAECARSASQPGLVRMFDETGVGRLLAELAFSPLSRELIATTLAPLDALGATAGGRAIETLAAYLDAQCSPRRAATALNLHPNAVAYRIKRIVQLLDADLADPDIRLMLHLACRTRLAG
jgi:sugar diacid utilization regulator